MVVSRGNGSLRPARIPIHRNLFAASSPVFASMFERDMAEKKQNFVFLEDFSAEAIRGLRSFFYTGRLELGDRTSVYLEMARRFDVPELRKAVATELLAQLSLQSVCDTAVLAHEFELSDVFKACRAKIWDEEHNFLVPKEDWRRLEKDNRKVWANLIDPLF